MIQEQNLTLYRKILIFIYMKKCCFQLILKSIGFVLKLTSKKTESLILETALTFYIYNNKFWLFKIILLYT